MAIYPQARWATDAVRQGILELIRSQLQIILNRNAHINALTILGERPYPDETRVARFEPREYPGTSKYRGPALAGRSILLLEKRGAPDRAAVEFVKISPGYIAAHLGNSCTTYTIPNAKRLRFDVNQQNVRQQMLDIGGFDVGPRWQMVPIPQGLPMAMKTLDRRRSNFSNR